MAHLLPSIDPEIDHLILGCSQLDQGIRWVKERFGIEPIVGGRHPDYGTHNALVSIGEMSYLEIMAPDPAAASLPERSLFGLRELSAPRLVTWVLRRGPIEESAELVDAAGVAMGQVLPGMRQRPDGSIISWKLTDPYADRLGGAVPFLITWGDSIHPALTAPRIGTLASLAIESPWVERLERALRTLDLTVPVTQAPRTQLYATIRTPSGDVLLR